MDEKERRGVQDVSRKLDKLFFGPVVKALRKKTRSQEYLDAKKADLRKRAFGKGATDGN